MPIKNVAVLLLFIFLPAALIEIGYITFFNITENLGLPNINALALSVLFVMLPIMILIILFYSKKELGYNSIRKMILYHNPIKTKRFVLYTLVLLCIGTVVFVLGKPLDNLIYENCFLFVPQKYVLTINPEIHTKTQLLITLFSVVFITGIIAPITEEVYFRGFLLPRMEWMGIFAPVANAVLFSLYHFWSPWQFITRVVLLIPFCYASYKTKNLKLTIVVHCLFNILGDGISVLIMVLN